MLLLSGKVVIVTGGDHTRGLQVASTLANFGATVVLSYSQEPAGPQGFVASLRAMGKRAIAIHADLAHADDVHRIFETTKDCFGAPHALVNAAGYFELSEGIAESEVHRHLALCTHATQHLIKAAAQQFRLQGGAFIQLSSTKNPDNRSVDEVAFYGLTSAFEAYVLSQASALRSQKMRINAIAVAVDPSPAPDASDADDYTTEKFPREDRHNDLSTLVTLLVSDDGAHIWGKRYIAR